MSQPPAISAQLAALARHLGPRILDLVPREQLRAIYESGFRDGSQIADRRSWQEGFSAGKRDVAGEVTAGLQHLAKTFAAGSEQEKPRRAFMQVFSPEDFEEVFSTYFTDEHHPDGLPGYSHKFFGMTPDEFADKSGKVLKEIEVHRKDGKIIKQKRWVNKDKTAPEETGKDEADAGTESKSKEEPQAAKKPPFTGHPAIDSLVASRSSASPAVREAIDAALYNVGIDDPEKPPKKLAAEPHLIARRLVSEWSDLHDKGTPPDELKPLTDAMEVHGLQPIATEPAESTTFDGRYHEGPAGLFTGDHVEIDRSGWSYVDPDGRESVVQKAKVKPYNFDRDYSDAELETFASTTTSADLSHPVGQPYKSSSGKSWRVNKDVGGGKIRSVPAPNPENVQKREDAKKAKGEATAAKVKAKGEAEDALHVAFNEPNKLTHQHVLELDKHLQQFTGEQLKNVARQVKVKLGGRKAELINRLRDHVTAKLANRGATASPPAKPPVVSPPPPNLNKPQVEVGEKAPAPEAKTSKESKVVPEKLLELPGEFEDVLHWQKDRNHPVARMIAEDHKTLTRMKAISERLGQGNVWKEHQELAKAEASAISSYSEAKASGDKKAIARRASELDAISDKIVANEKRVASLSKAARAIVAEQLAAKDPVTVKSRMLKNSSQITDAAIVAYNKKKRPDDKNLKPFTKEQQRDIEGAQEWLSKITEANGIELNVDFVPTTRGYHIQSKDGDTVVGIAPGGGDRWPGLTTVHELAHAIEKKKPGALARAQQFLKYRCAGEELKDIGDVAGIEGLKGEMGRKDQFDRTMDQSSAYYVGKKYKSGTTEVLTVGIEQLYRDPARFIAADPEYAAFVIGILGDDTPATLDLEPEEPARVG